MPGHADDYQLHNCPRCLSSLHCRVRIAQTSSNESISLRTWALTVCREGARLSLTHSTKSRHACRICILEMASLQAEPRAQRCRKHVPFVEPNALPLLLNRRGNPQRRAHRASPRSSVSAFTLTMLIDLSALLLWVPTHSTSPPFRHGCGRRIIFLRCA